jgi:imidazolonepropionase-like amidohydrolase
MLPFPDPGAEPSGSASLVVRAAKVFVKIDLEDTRVLHPGVVVMEGPRVVAVGRPEEVEIPAGAEVLDLGDRWVFPGFVDLHCHIAGGGYNDMVYLSNPDLVIVNNVEPENRRLKNALAGGVTTVLFIPGSGTNMGGHGVLVKTAGRTLDEMLVRQPGSLKIAQAGNPEWYWYGVRRSFMNWNLRQTLERAREYHEGRTRAEENGGEGGPAFDPTWETLRGLFRGEFPVSLHTQWYQVALESITMLKRDLGLDIFIDHGTFEAWHLGEIAARYEVPVINGPRQFYVEYRDRQIQGNAWGWWKEGVRELGINTDAGVVPQHELPLQAAMAVRLGWDDPLLALRGITMVAARTIGAADRLGSLEPGKDADLCAWTGDPLDPASCCVMTVVNGKVAYDRDRDGQRF